MWLAQHRHRVDSYWLVITTLVPPKVTPRDEALAPSAQPDVAVHLRFPLRHEAVNFQIGALCRALHDIGVKPIYRIPPPLLCRRWLPGSAGSHILTRHLIRAWRRHHCCIDVYSDSKRSALKICSKNLNGMLVYGRQLGKLKHGWWVH